MSFRELSNIIHPYRRVKKQELVVYMGKKKTIKAARFIVFQWNPSAAFLNLIYTAAAGRVSNCFHFVVTWNFSEAFSLTSDAARTAIKPLSRWSASLTGEIFHGASNSRCPSEYATLCCSHPRMEVAYQRVPRPRPRRCEFIAGSCRREIFRGKFFRRLIPAGDVWKTAKISDRDRN